jgi:predicted GNAT family acetyltransferase
VIGQADGVDGPISVVAPDDPREVLVIASPFLAAEPVRHNLVATLLHRCVRTDEPGRFWIAATGDRVLGVTFQSPLHFFATTTPMPPAAAVATVDRIVDDGVELPGVNGEAAVSSGFAGQWTERTRSAARPVEGMRLYEVDDVVVPAASGRVRRATEADRELAAQWLDAFAAETGEPGGDADAVARRRIATGELWFHDDGGSVALTGMSIPVGGATRVGPVYTPPELRGRGYASKLVADRSAVARADGLRCLLYADLANPTSNAIYRAIGYRPVAELVRYEFGAGARSALINAIGTEMS